MTGYFHLLIINRNVHKKYFKMSWIFIRTPVLLSVSNEKPVRKPASDASESESESVLPKNKQPSAGLPVDCRTARL